MKIKVVDIDMLEWKVELIEVESYSDVKKLGKSMNDFKIDESEIEEIQEAIKDGIHNGGWHYYNTGMRKSMIILYPMTSSLMRANILCHEKRHAEDRILSHLNIKDIEASAHLAGYLGQMLL